MCAGLWKAALASSSAPGVGAGPMSAEYSVVTVIGAVSTITGPPVVYGMISVRAIVWVVNKGWGMGTVGVSHSVGHHAGLLARGVSVGSVRVLGGRLSAVASAVSSAVGVSVSVTLTYRALLALLCLPELLV